MAIQLLSAEIRYDYQIHSGAHARQKTTFPPTPPPDEDLTHVEVSQSAQLLPSLSIRSATNTVVAVVGVGYVGCRLVEAFAAVYKVLAFDVSEERLAEISSRFQGLPVHCTSQETDLSSADAFLIAVPTTLNANKSIDTTYLESAVAMIEQYARPGTTVIVESSVAVGMTRQFLGPLASRKALKLGMSPERVDPGRVLPAFEDIPKVISGIDADSIEAIYEIYGNVFSNLVTVKSLEVAEMTKLYENCQRMVCAAYANEMADACVAMGIDPWEVSRAAASKPFGYLPFQPGAGVGGHCIPVNPHYLFTTCSMPLLKHATEASQQRPANVARRLMRELLETKNGYQLAKRTRVLVVGVAFKRGQSVTSHAPGVAIIVALLNEWEVYVEFADPLVGADQLHYVPKTDTALDWNRSYLEAFDGIIVAVGQVGMDLTLLKDLQGVVVHDYCPCI